MIHSCPERNDDPESAAAAHERAWRFPEGHEDTDDNGCMSDEAYAVMQIYSEVLEGK